MGQETSPERTVRITPEVSLVVDRRTDSPLRVSSSFPLAKWKARQIGDAARVTHPGTALLVGQDWFEIIGVRADPSRPGAIAYDLAPWDGSFVIREAGEITPEACRAAARGHRDAEARRRKGDQLALLPFLTGLLPGEDQRRLESEYGVPAMRATFLSALPLLLGATLALLAGYALSQGHDFGRWNRLVALLWAWRPLLYYLAAESMIRISVGLSSEDPLGSLFVALPIHFARALGARALGATAQSPRVSPTLPDDFANARDTVRPWPGPEADLEVLSRLPKDHWTVNTTSVIYRGTTYALVDREELTQGPERYRFLLRVPDSNVLCQHVFEYEPEEVRRIYRAQRRLAASTWVETFPWVWGLLDHGRQERLAAIYSYDPRRMTQWTIIVVAIGGALAVVRGYLGLEMQGGLIDGLVLFFGVVLLWDAGLRWSYWRGNHWRQSLFSFLVRSPADRFLRWR